MHSNHSIGLICLSLILNKHCLDSASCSVVVWVHGCPKNVVFSCFSPVDDRVLRTKDNTNVADNSCFLNHMTVKLNYDSILPSVDPKLMLAYFGLEISQTIVIFECFAPITYHQLSVRQRMELLGTTVICAGLYSSPSFHCLVVCREVMRSISVVLTPRRGCDKFSADS